MPRLKAFTTVLRNECRKHCLDTHHTLKHSVDVSLHRCHFSIFHVIRLPSICLHTFVCDHSRTSSKWRSSSYIIVAIICFGHFNSRRHCNIFSVSKSVYNTLLIVSNGIIFHSLSSHHCPASKCLLVRRRVQSQRVLAAASCWLADWTHPGVWGKDIRKGKLWMCMEPCSCCSGASQCCS